MLASQLRNRFAVPSDRPGGLHLHTNASLDGSSPVPCYDYFLQIKKQYPKHLALVRIGDFYETNGFDALLLVQVCGINPMASSEHGMVRAGVPVAGMPKSVRAVNAAGLTVVVCNEMPSPYGSKKDRYILGVSTPAHPIIFPEGNSSDEFYMEGDPIIGVAASKTGYMMFEYKHELCAVHIIDQLTVEALMARLQVRRPAPPLLLHRSVGQVSSSDASAAQVERAVKAAFKGVVQTKQYGIDAAADAVEGFKVEVRKTMDLGPSFCLPSFYVGRSRSGRPQPPYLSTITNLGFNKTPGMPNIIIRLRASLKDTPAECRRWLERTLRHLPPPSQALMLHNACSALCATSSVLPDLYAGMSMKKVSDVLQASKANEDFFRELHGLLGPVASLLQSPSLSVVSENLLLYLNWELQVPGQGVRWLAGHVTKALSLIEGVVDLHPEGRGDDSEEEGADDSQAGSADGEEAAAAATATPGKWKRVQRVSASDYTVARGVEASEKELRRMVSRNEGFRGRVRADIMAGRIAKVDTLQQQVREEALRVLRALLAVSADDLVKHRPSLKYSDDDRDLWIIVPRVCAAHKELDRLGLTSPYDRKGHLVNDAKVTKLMSSLMQQYKEATDEATKEVQNQLTGLCHRLVKREASDLLLPLVMSAQASIIARALVDHVTEARERRWCVPELLPLDPAPVPLSTTPEAEPSPSPAAAPPASPPPRHRLEVSGMFPFWTDVLHPGTVCNDLVLDRTVLLTGPNMAGKSTALRCIASVAILACSGFMVPATSAKVPFYDAFMLRNFSGDSPQEGLSSFALECVDMRAVLRDSSHRSLVLLDELGKGTEVAAATSLSAAMIEALLHKQATVVFATHLHELVELLREREQQGDVQYMKMEVQEKEGWDLQGHSVPKQDPTWRIVPGVCKESLAMQVALQQGVPADVVLRAQEVYQGLQANAQAARQQGAAAAAAGAASAPGPTAAAEELEEAGEGESEGKAGAAVAEIPAEPPAPVAPQHTLEIAAEVLKSVVARDQGLEHLGTGDAGAGGSGSGGSIAVLEDGGSAVPGPQVTMIGVGQRPPPLHLKSSAVYVVRWETGFFYVGETDDIISRLSKHRRRNTHKGHSGPGLRAAYVLVPEGKSKARQLQMQLCHALQAQGFALSSDTDSRLKSFGSAAGGSHTAAKPAAAGEGAGADREEAGAQGDAGVAGAADGPAAASLEQGSGEAEVAGGAQEEVKAAGAQGEVQGGGESGQEALQVAPKGRRGRKKKGSDGSQVEEGGKAEVPGGADTEVQGGDGSSQEAPQAAPRARRGRKKRSEGGSQEGA